MQYTARAKRACNSGYNYILRFIKLHNYVIISPTLSLFLDIPHGQNALDFATTGFIYSIII